MFGYIEQGCKCYYQPKNLLLYEFDLVVDNEPLEHGYQESLSIQFWDSAAQNRNILAGRYAAINGYLQVNHWIDSFHRSRISSWIIAENVYVFNESIPQEEYYEQQSEDEENTLITINNPEEGDDSYIESWNLWDYRIEQIREGLERKQYPTVNGRFISDIDYGFLNDIGDDFYEQLYDGE